MSEKNNLPKILIADDDEDIQLALELLLNSQYQILKASTPKEIILQTERLSPDLVMLDMNFSRDTTRGQEGLDILKQINQSKIPVILMTAWGSVELAVEGLKLGAVDFIEKPWNKDKLLSSIEQQLKFSRVEQENSGYREYLSHRQSSQKEDNVLDGWICKSSPMQSIEQLIQQVAPTDASLLILGENGTGKSMLAERIHLLSARKNAPFIATNMAAIPENLFESELFGHQKGAFTDAKQNRIGRFQLANQGTLFFDEIGCLPLNLQPKLLRVLETGQYEVLGSSKTQSADVRLISATNADLNQLVKDNQFRQDLLYRLNTLVITMPPLRERADDIEALTHNLIARLGRKYQKTHLSVSDEAFSKLRRHNWPGNIRELSHVIERAILFCNEDIIRPRHLLIDPSEQDNDSVALQSLEQAERQLIEKAMRVSANNVIEAAKILEISRNALYRRLEKHNIEIDEKE